jgi:hypothetical protein
MSQHGGTKTRSKYFNGLVAVIWQKYPKIFYASPDTDVKQITPVSVRLLLLETVGGDHNRFSPEYAFISDHSPSAC